MNRIVLIGRLTKDVELKNTASGIAVASFTLAVDRGFKNAQGEKETDFINIVAWKKLAERCAQYIGKGSQVALEGRLQIRGYEDAEGKKRTIAEVVADDVQFLSKNKETQEVQEAQDGSQFKPTIAETDDDLPF